MSLKNLVTGTAIMMLLMLFASAQFLTNCPDWAVVSDQLTQVDSHNSVEVTPHPAWINITGAKWIWYQDESLTIPNITETKTFTRTFNVNLPVNYASLEISADNGYKVWVNGLLVDDKSAVSNWNVVNTYDIKSKLTGGANTIKVDVTNFALEGNYKPTDNPGGLLYKITLNDNCSPPNNLPEFGSVAAVLAILAIAPAAAYVISRKR